MQAFMDKDFLLDTDIAKRLFHEAAKSCPIIDYHCHLSPKEIWEDTRFGNITRVWLGGDHYKWRLMRCAGVPERFITGDANDHEKFLAWARVLGKAIGNPLYHWSHLELQRFFDWHGALSEKTAEEVWNVANAKLQSPEFSARGLISRSNVDIICTTDDPIDSLEYHEKLAADKSFATTVLPAWRPDKVVNIDKPTWAAYISTLEEVTGMHIRSLVDLRTALSKRMDFFHAHGCRLSDHGLNYVPYAPASSREELESIFMDRRAGAPCDEHQVAVFQYACLSFFAAEYHRRGWTMQLHYGCRRDNNLPQFAALGPDTGYDCIGETASASQTAAFLGALEHAGDLPRTILYSLNPHDNQAIDSICGCFQSDEAVGKIQHGSAWWFNDHIQGMTEQLTSLANLGYLAGFVGMLTDSRSFLSYPRHEYFRRILCRLLGKWVEDGRYPADFDLLAEIVRDISYGNAKRYFQFPVKELD